MPNVTLYNFPLSIYAQFVRVALAEKGVVYDIEPVDITRAGEQFRPEYLKVNPRAVVPTLKVDGECIIDGVRIMRRIDADFEGPALTPADTAEAQAMEEWLSSLDSVRYDALFYSPGSPYSPGPPALFGRLARLEQIHEELPEHRHEIGPRIANMKKLIAIVSDPEAREALRAGIERRIEELDATLKHCAFAAGSTYSLADVMWTVALARFEMHGLDVLWQDKPRVQDYIARMESRESYRRAPVFKTAPVAPKPTAQASAATAAA